MKELKFSWEVVGKGKYQSDLTYVLSLNGVRKALIFFVGNHVERDDTYYIKYADDINKLRGYNDNDACNSLSEAKKYAEKEIKSLMSTVETK